MLNPCHQAIQTLQTSLFLCNFIGRSNQINSALTAQFLSFWCQQKKTGPNQPSDRKFMAVLRDCSRFHVLHTGRPGKFCWNVDGKPLWDRSCFSRKQTTGKCQRSCSVHDIVVRSDEGYATAEAESIPLGCSGTGNLFVLLCNFIGRSNQTNSALMAQCLLFSCQQKNWPKSAVEWKIYGRFT